MILRDKILSKLQILFINCVLNRLAIYGHFSLVEVAISLAIIMWLSSASLGNACIIMHWIVVFVFKFCQMTLFLSTCFPTLKIITDKYSFPICLFILGL